MNIKGKIYYDVNSGNVILWMPEQTNAVSVSETTIEHDITTFTTLSERNRSTFDVIELLLGAYAQDFSECNGYRVNVTTKMLEFSYPDPNVPQPEPVFQPPLTSQINDLKAQLETAQEAIDFLLMGGM